MSKVVLRGIHYVRSKYQDLYQQMIFSSSLKGVLRTSFSTQLSPSRDVPIPDNSKERVNVLHVH